MQKRGAYQEAADACRESLRIRRLKAPHQRLTIAITTNALANCLAFIGNDADTIQAVQDNLTAFRAALPPKGNLLAKVVIQTATFLLQHSELEKAEVLLKEAMEIYRESDQPPGPYRELAVKMLFGVRNRQDDKSIEFLAKRTDLIKYLRTMLPDDSLELAYALAEHAEHLKDRNRATEALPLAIEALQIRTEHEGKPQRIRSNRALITQLCLHVGANKEMSADNYRAAQEALQPLIKNKPAKVAVIVAQGALHYRLGQYDDALSTLTFSKQQRAELKENWGVPSAFVAMAQFRKGETEDARKTFDMLQQWVVANEGTMAVEVRRVVAEARGLIAP